MALARRIAALTMIVLGCLSLAAPSSAQDDRIVDLIELEGVIDPTAFEYLESRLTQAEEDGAHVAIVRLDTPGGLDVSMRSIVQQMLSSDVPIVVWVAPQGARAASAGTFITYAGHLAYMAEATAIGAASPVNLGGDTSEVLQQKVENDAAAFIRGIAIQRGRDAGFAEASVRDAESIDATEALERDVINGIASSLRELLQDLDGREVEVRENAPDPNVTLETWDETAGGIGAPSVTIRFQSMNVMERLLHAITNPDVAYFLLLIGMFGIVFELYNPGIGLAGIIGGVCLLLGFYALSVLPTNWAGVLLLVLAVAFFLVDLHTAGLGIWTIGGTAALIAGGLLLFAGAAAALRVSNFSILGAVVLTLLFFISVMTAALRVRLRKPITGEEGIIGMVGEAKTDIAPEGTVMTKGALWRARTMETGIAAGSKVKIMASEGLVLLVEPMHESPPKAPDAATE
jgi:membrane-bound serine protease (ClpP class)